MLNGVISSGIRFTEGINHRIQKIGCKTVFLKNNLIKF